MRRLDDRQGFPGLGKSYVVAIPMASIGPITVIAFGIGDNVGWAAYSCDPERKCLPVKLVGPHEVGQAHGRAATEGLRGTDHALVPRGAEELSLKR